MDSRGRGDAVAALRRRIAAIKAVAGAPAQSWREAPPLTLGVPEIDRILPGGGLARGGLHEVLSGQASNGGMANRGGSGAALAFTAVLAARRAALAGLQTDQVGGQVLWCPARRGLYGPGLAAFGLGAGQLILVHGRDDQQRLWAMEEALKCTGLAMVVGEVGRLDLGQSRRLQLAAEASGVTALLLPRKQSQGGSLGADLGVSAALTRWRITAQPSAPTNGYVGIGAARFRVELLRCKGGRPGEWLLQWNGDGFAECGHEHSHEYGHEDGGERRKTNPVPVVAPMADGPAVPGLAARA
ncbi:MAG: protein imuA [Alphaproteobacteria bacterium]|nr:protein imuA [Alphaproteobacteria bacterium]